MSNDQMGAPVPGAPPPKKGMSTGVKVLLGLLAVGGVFVLICCGGSAWFASRTIMTDPAKIADVQKSIADIELPSRFTPTMAMNLPIGPGIKMAIYQAGGADSMLLLMEMNVPGASPQDMQSQMQQALQQQGKSTEMNIESTETRTFTIGGQECEFQFSKGTTIQGNKPMRQVTGAFPSFGGTAMLMMAVPEDQWDENETVTMVESIKTVQGPAGGTTATTPEDSGTPETVPNGAAPDMQPESTPPDNAVPATDTET